jgi:hypothetical protein
MRVRGGRVHDNRFYNGRWGWYCISGSDGLIFERNQLAGADLMSTGGGLNCLDGSRYSQNVWYAGNDLRHMNGWDRESMTSDAGGGPYIGKVTAGDGAQLTLASEPKWGGDWSGAGVFVLQGKGAGQIRRVTRHAGAQVILDRPLDVPLDATSELTITQYQGHYLLVGNRFADCGAMQFFGTGIENIVAGNQAERMQGLHAWALWYYGFQPCFYVQFHDNRLSGSYYHWSSAGDSFIGVSGHLHEGYNGPLNLGSVVRRNTLRDNAGIRVNGAVRDALVEGNDLADCDTGVFVSGGCTRVLVRGNRFARVKRETADEDAERRAQAERLKRFLELKDPVASWDFEALANGRFADGAGNRFDARPEGTVKVVADGRKGKAAAFDGTGWLRVDEPAVFNAPNLTIDFWVRPSKLSGRFGLVTKRFNGCGCPFVVNQSGASIGFEAAAPEGNWPYNFTGPPALAAGKWTRVTVVLAEGKGVCLYLDGRPAAEKLFATPRQANGEPLIIGREAWGGDPPKGDTPGPFVGTLDELRIWTRALSAAEVAGLG